MNKTGKVSFILLAFIVLVIAVIIVTLGIMFLTWKFTPRIG